MTDSAPVSDHFQVPIPPAPAICTESTESIVRKSVGRVINRLIPRAVPNERRKDFRYPYPHLVTLTPLGVDGQPILEQQTVVVGKNITERGIDFFHREALPHRRVLLTLEAEDGYQTTLVTDLLWTRFTRQGWYDNGGRFIQVISSPDMG